MFEEDAFSCFFDGWSCFKTFKMPKRPLKMAENVKSCLRIIQDGLWCFQRYLKMLLKVAWNMVKDYQRSLKSIMSHSPSQGTSKNTIILTLRFTPSEHFINSGGYPTQRGKIPALLPWLFFHFEPTKNGALVQMTFPNFKQVKNLSFQVPLGLSGVYKNQPSQIQGETPFFTENATLWEFLGCGFSKRIYIFIE